MKRSSGRIKKANGVTTTLLVDSNVMCLNCFQLEYYKNWYLNEEANIPLKFSIFVEAGPSPSMRLVPLNEDGQEEGKTKEEKAKKVEVEDEKKVATKVEMGSEDGYVDAREVIERGVELIRA